MMKRRLAQEKFRGLENCVTRLFEIEKGRGSSAMSDAGQS